MTGTVFPQSLQELAERQVSPAARSLMDLAAASAVKGNVSTLYMGNGSTAM